MPQLKKQFPLVALIGRTNVGKSTLFNRLVGEKRALVSDIAGTTRDRRYGECEWNGKNVTLVDTAGLDVKSEKAIDKKALDFARQTIADADLILFIVDSRDGLLPQDKEFAKLVKKYGRPTLVVANKVDSPKYFHHQSEFYKLGWNEVFPVSAKTGSGTGDLLDKVVEVVTSETPPLANGSETGLITNEDNIIKVAIVGKPNVGKSSLFNQIIGEELSIVSETPHTTRDSQDITIEYSPSEASETSKTSGTSKTSETNDTNKENILITFIDTAGIIKNRKINDRLDEMSIEQSYESIGRADISLLVIDASEPITMQDKNLSREILEKNKSLIFVVNKWDKLKDKTTDSDQEYIHYLHGHFPFLTWAPVIFVSAKTSFKISRLLNVVVDIYNNQRKNIKQKELDDLLHRLLKKKRPSRAQGERPPYIHGLKQISQTPLTFEVLADRAENINFAYRRYLQNSIREHFGFVGCGIKIILAEK